MYANNDKTAPRPRLTVPQLRQYKRDHRKLVALTAYDASFAAVLDASGVDVILVGDSLGMVVQGHDSTLPRSEEHTSELQSLMRISYAVFCLKKKKETKE